MTPVKFYYKNDVEQETQKKYISNYDERKNEYVKERRSST